MGTKKDDPYFKYSLKESRTVPAFGETDVVISPSPNHGYKTEIDFFVTNFVCTKNIQKCYETHDIII